jgi:hypothetical protein
MVEADVILWVLRANRAGRGADVALRERFVARMDAQPNRRRPPLILVPTAADALLPGWPYPETSAVRHVDGQPAQRGFLVFLAHVGAGLAHRLDAVVERHEMLCRRRAAPARPPRPP